MANSSAPPLEFAPSACDLLQVLSQERITTAHEGLESDGFAKHVHILVQKYALIVLQLVKVIEKLHRILA